MLAISGSMIVSNQCKKTVIFQCQSVVWEVARHAKAHRITEEDLDLIEDSRWLWSLKLLHEEM